jgi:hypothetical protein
MPNKIPIIKIQMLSVWVIRICDLEFIWYLMLGNWCFTWTALPRVPTHNTVSREDELSHVPLLHLNQTGVVRHPGSVFGNHSGGSQQIDAASPIRAPRLPRLQRIIHA